jgi:hypothetical protein
MQNVDATPQVSVGDHVTLFRRHYPFVKLQLRTSTQN